MFPCKKGRKNVSGKGFCCLWSFLQQFLGSLTLPILPIFAWQHPSLPPTKSTSPPSLHTKNIREAVYSDTMHPSNTLKICLGGKKRAFRRFVRRKMNWSVTWETSASISCGSLRRRFKNGIPPNQLGWMIWSFNKSKKTSKHLRSQLLRKRPSGPRPLHVPLLWRWVLALSGWDWQTSSWTRAEHQRRLARKPVFVS